MGSVEMPGAMRFSHRYTLLAQQTGSVAPHTCDG